MATMLRVQRLASALLGLAAIGQCVKVHLAEETRGNNNIDDAKMRSQEWIDAVSEVLRVPGIESPETKTAVVTFAGKKNIEYIDGAVMLGMSVQKHLPGVPMVALIIQDMHFKNQQLLRHAGWKLVVVPNWDLDYCGKDCDMEFLGRWHDSFEKINAFRLPFERVLFLDSDTYIFSDRVSELLNGTELPEGHIAMAMDGCKTEYNSGVMLYRPKLSVFTQMLQLVSVRQREQILDQNLVNEVYRDKIKEIPREFNCVDTLGVQPGQRKACTHHCSKNVVVAHFTGHPKPTAPKRRLLELVRRPGSPEIACMNTNFGSCAKWSEYYCDIRNHSRRLSKNIQYWLKSTGDCCHTPFDPELDKESCKECPSFLQFQNKEYESVADGRYMKTNIKPTKFNGGRPIYLKRKKNQTATTSEYLFFIQKQMLWAVGYNYTANSGILAYAGIEAQCPRDASAWSIFNQTKTQFERAKVAVKGVPNHNAPAGTERAVWNVHKHRWEAEELPGLLSEEEWEM